MLHGNLAALPLPDEAVDVVVNFQVIEHLWDQGQFVAECLRVLRPGGVLLMSTPNRITFSPGRDTPLNPFHTRELNAAELTELLTGAGFSVESMLGVFHGSGLAALDARHGGSIIDAQIDRAVADAPWPAELLADVASVTTADFDLTADKTSTTAWIWWRSRCGRDIAGPVGRHRSGTGLFTLVLHTHLPWLAHHGRWPVGEEWLYQSWSASYLPLMRVLRTLAAEDRHHLLTLGMTPVVTAQLDDPYSLSGMHHWLANWQLRAVEAATLQDPLREFGIREQAEADRRSPSSRRCGSTAAARCCGSCSTPAPSNCSAARWRTRSSRCSNPRLREFALREGLADAQLRFAHTPTGIWAPECAYAPGMEIDYAAAGVGHFMVDGPSLHGDTTLGRPVGESDVVAFGRDLQVSYRVWSPKSGYPGHAAYRDFHTYDHVTGLKPARVTGRNVASDAKAPYDPERADSAVDVARRRFRRGRAAAAHRRERAHRPARSRGRRLRHRVVRPLVVRGPASGWNGCCAHCPRPGSGSARCPTRSPTASSAHRSNCRPALGVPARTGRCGPANRWPIWSS